MSLSPRSIQPLPVSSSLPSPSQTVFAGAFPQQPPSLPCKSLLFWHLPDAHVRRIVHCLVDAATQNKIRYALIFFPQTHPKAGLRRRSHVTIPNFFPKSPSVRLDSLKGRPVLRYQNRPETRGTSEIPNVAYQKPKPN